MEDVEGLGGGAPHPLMSRTYEYGIRLLFTAINIISVPTGEKERKGEPSHHEAKKPVTRRNKHFIFRYVRI